MSCHVVRSGITPRNQRYRLWRNENLNEVDKIYRASKNNHDAVLRRAIANIYANMFGGLFPIFIINKIWNKRLEKLAHSETKWLNSTGGRERD
jgi:hypothetical protein